MPASLSPSCRELGLAAARTKQAAPQLFQPNLHDAPAPDANPGVLSQIGENYGRFFDHPLQQLKHIYGGGEWQPGGGRPNNFTPQQELQQRYPWWQESPPTPTAPPDPKALADRTWQGFQNWWQGHQPTTDEFLQQAASGTNALQGGASPPAAAPGAVPDLAKLQAGLGSGLETARNFIGQHPYASSAAGLGLAAYLYNQHRQNQRDQERQQMLQALAASGGGGGGAAGRPSRVMEYL